METLAEHQLLLCCARSRLDAATAEMVRTLLRQRLDWPSLLGTAQAHGLIPLLYWNLKTVGPAGVPPPIFRYLQDGFHANASHNLALTDGLLQVLRLFEARGVQAVPFKGPVLAALAYGNVLLRQFSDLDLLVHERHVDRARDLLRSEGFHWERSGLATDAAERSALRHHILNRNGLCIELHWAFAEEFYGIPLDRGLWRRLQRTSLAGTEVATLAPEDLLPALCVHGARHRWEGLKWLCDVAELARAATGMAWDRVLHQARRQGIQRILFLGLFLAREVLGSELPEDVRERAGADPMVRALAAEVRANLFRGKVAESVREAEKYPFDLRVRERLGDRVRYCRRLGIIPDGVDNAVLPRPARWYLCLAVPLTVNARDREFVRLPAPAAFLYTLVRPVRLAAQLARRLLSRGRPTAP